MEPTSIGGPGTAATGLLPATTEPTPPLQPVEQMIAQLKAAPTLVEHGNQLRTIDGATGSRAATDARVHQGAIVERQTTQETVCHGMATFSAIGPLPQAPGESAFEPGHKPENGSVAIAGASTFGFGRQALREGAAAAIKIEPVGLDSVLKQTGGPKPPYQVGDYGDVNIRNSATTRFDVYRFATMDGARQFGVRTVPTNVTVPAGGHCPPGFKANK